MRRLIRLSLVVIAAGCSVATEPLTLDKTDTNVAGSYGLGVAAGRLLPFTTGTTDTQQVYLVADTMAIAKDNTWVDTSYYILEAFIDGSQTNAQTATSGTYAISNGTINFTMISGGSSEFTGAVTGNALALIFNGGKYLYSK